MCRAKNLIVQVSAKVRSRKRKTFLRTTCNENIVKKLPEWSQFYYFLFLKFEIIWDHLQREDVILKQHCRTKLKSIITWYLFEFQLGMVTHETDFAAWLLLRPSFESSPAFGWVPTIPVFGLTWHWWHIKFWSDILVILNLKGVGEWWCRRQTTVWRCELMAWR